MANYVQPCNKRQKTTREPMRTTETGDFFSGINKIEYKGENASYEDTLCYRYYNPNERIHGRTMEEWIRPAVSVTAFRYNGMDSFGKPTYSRLWDDHTNSTDNYKRCIKACFEFSTKLGIKHWTAFDRDFVPETETVEENTMYFDDMVDYIQELQQRIGLKPLWISADLHSNPRFASGAATSYDCNIMLQAAQRVKKCLEASNKLNSDCFLMWNGREGFRTVINTDIHREIKHFARLLKMTSDFKERLGYRGQLLFNPSTAHPQYNSFTDSYKDHVGELQDGDTFTPYTWEMTSGLCFLKHYNLDRHYKMCVKPGKEHFMGSVYNSTGSVEITNFRNFTVKDATLVMKNIIEQGGIQPGGINLNIMPSRESVDIKDLFITYIHYIDTLAKGLRVAVKILTDQIFVKNVQQRYISYYSGFGSRLSNGEATLEECDEHIRKLQNQYPETISSSRQEHWELAFQNYINKITFAN